MSRRGAPRLGGTLDDLQVGVGLALGGHRHGDLGAGQRLGPLALHGHEADVGVARRAREGVSADCSLDDVYELHPHPSRDYKLGKRDQILVVANETNARRMSEAFSVHQGS